MDTTNFPSSRAVLIVCSNTNVSLHMRWMALEVIWSARTLSFGILSLIFLCQWIPLTKCAKLTHNNHVELLPSRLSALIMSLLSINAVNKVEHGVPSSSSHEHPLVKNCAILLHYSSLVSSCSTIISPMANPLLQNMLKASSTSASISL